MTTSLSIRFASFALAAVVTFALFAGIDSLAQVQHSGGLQMSQAQATAAARS